MRTVVRQGNQPQESEHGQHPMQQEASVDWKEDEACQLVFFAVLEGLYREGISSEVVSSIIGPASETSDATAMQQRLKRSFVVDCPLCQPTFEAFLVYQNRPSTFSDGSTASHFGNGVDEELKSRLLSDNTQTRLEALRSLVQKWVATKLDSLSVDRQETEQWLSEMQQRSSMGKNQLMALLGEGDENYRGWSMYWGCAACNGCNDATREWATEN